MLPLENISCPPGLEGFQQCTVKQFPVSVCLLQEAGVGVPDEPEAAGQSSERSQVSHLSAPDKSGQIQSKLRLTEVSSLTVA